ncbi:MerR family transcriptional regulator [Aliiroseovarius sediminis]|uniref:MerR family transcriptional regulator n=1 Tax=Aliiroseovarius sediminis TaxID=2925839 RepID=UPI001F57F2E2|nr:MerR family transcriptional regulator [Aliiroseovarius sediminis]MCI2393334.1 MerR family transcriptional regulator [Aliiroseovarius sediminis]
MEKKSPDAFRTISEVADWLGVPTHVLRFWESRFSQVKPVKRAGGRRYYRPNDMELLGGIRKLLHEDGMTIRGVQKLLREEGIKHVAAMSPPLDSTAMRDVTPSNVVPLASKPGPKDSTDASPSKTQDTAPDGAPADEPTQKMQPDEPSQDDALGQTSPVVAHPDPPQSEPTIAPTPDADPERAEPTPHFTRADTNAPDASYTPPHDGSNDTPPADATDPAPSFGSNRVANSGQSTEPADGLENSESTAPAEADLFGEPAAKTSIPPASPDISHVPADPGDDEPAPRPAFATALRQARKAGTGAHIPTLQALADRLETLGQQMAERPGQTR